MKNICVLLLILILSLLNSCVTVNTYIRNFTLNESKIPVTIKCFETDSSCFDVIGYSGLLDFKRGLSEYERFQVKIESTNKTQFLIIIPANSSIFIFRNRGFESLQFSSIIINGNEIIDKETGKYKINNNIRRSGLAACRILYDIR